MSLAQVDRVHARLPSRVWCFHAPMNPTPFASQPQPLPWPPVISRPLMARRVQHDYEKYVAAFTAALAIDHPASRYVDLSHDEKAPLRAERWALSDKREQVYEATLARATKPKVPRKQAVPAEGLQGQLFEEAWPRDFQPIVARFPFRPYVSQDLTYTTVRPRHSAVRWRYVQYDPPSHQHVLIVDYDAEHAGAMPALEAWRAAGLPTPTWVACTPGTLKGHLAWALKSPVCSSSAGRLKPLAYLAAIEQAYRTALKGDENFVGLLTKNPVHPDWEVHWLDHTPRTLDELAAAVQLPKPTRKKPAAVAPVGLGRKVHLFEAVRQWSYRAVAEYWQLGEEAWCAAVRSQVELINCGFGEPLSGSHRRSIAKSVARWVWRRFTASSKHLFVMATHTPRVQSLRGRRKGAKKRDANIDAARAMKDQGKSQREIAAALGVDQGTISRWLRREVE